MEVYIKMKKIASLALALMLLGSLAACQKADSGQGDVLTVALSPDFSPMEFVDTSKSGQEQFVGFDITLANHIAQELGKTLEIKPMSFDACQTAVQMGTVDMSISGFSWTAEREENYLISDYYIAGDNETEQVIITTVTDAQSGAFTTAESYAGLKVAAQAASLQEKLCQEALPEDTEIVLFKDINDAVLALQTGKVNAVAVADGNADAIIANNPDVAKSGFQFDVDPKYENNVILLNKEDQELLEQVNAILADCMAKDLYTGWYDAAKELAGIETAADIAYDDEGNAQ